MPVWPTVSAKSFSRLPECAHCARSSGGLAWHSPVPIYISPRRQQNVKMGRCVRRSINTGASTVRVPWRLTLVSAPRPVGEPRAFSLLGTSYMGARDWETVRSASRSLKGGRCPAGTSSLRGWVPCPPGCRRRLRPCLGTYGNSAGQGAATCLTFAIERRWGEPSEDVDRLASELELFEPG